MSTVDSLSISNYGMGNLYNDPAWQKYWMMSQQMDSLSNMQNANALNALSQAANWGATTTTTATSNPTFGNGAIPRATETAGGGLGAGWLLAGTALVGTAAYIASRGKTGKGFVENFKAGLKSFGKSSADVSKQFRVAEVGGKKVCYLPGKVNRIHVERSTTDPNYHVREMEPLLEKIGFSNGGTAKLSDLVTTKSGKIVLADGIAVRSGSFKTKAGDIVKFNKKGEVVPYTKYKEANEATKKEIDDFLAGLKEGKGLNKVDNLQVSINKDGVVRKLSNTVAGGDLTLDYALSNRFSIKDKAVDAYRLHNKSANNLLTKFEKNETRIGKIVGAEWTTKMHDGKEYTFILENDAIRGLKDSRGKILTQTEMDALQYRNGKKFENVFKKEKEFKNVVYAAA